MSLVTLILIIAAVGFLVWFILKFIPMPPPMQQLLVVLSVVFVVLYVLQGFGVISGFSSLRLR